MRKDGTPYYIGKGRGKRIFSKQRNINAPSDRNRIIICESYLTEIGAFAIERRLIRWHGRKDLGTGILRNMTNGGDGASGAIRSPETRKLISEAHKGKIFSKETIRKLSEAGKGRKHSEESKLKMSEIQKGKNKGKWGPMKGRTQSQEAKLKMSNAKKMKVFTPLGIYPSAHEAASIFNVHYTTISYRCRNNTPGWGYV